MVARTPAGQVAVAHKREPGQRRGAARAARRTSALFQGTSDTEVLVHLLAHQREGSIEERIRSSLMNVRGAYSLLFLTEKGIVAVRDPLASGRWSWAG